MPPTPDIEHHVTCTRCWRYLPRAEFIERHLGPYPVCRACTPSDKAQPGAKLMLIQDSCGHGDADMPEHRGPTELRMTPTHIDRDYTGSAGRIYRRK